MRHGLVALMTSLACLGGYPLNAGAITGEEAVRLVAQAMVDAGQVPPRMQAPVRALPSCSGTPRVTPLAGNWSSAEISCDQPTVWRRVLRTGAALSMPLSTRDSTGAAKNDLPLQTVLSVTRPLPRGARIGPDDVMLLSQAGTDPAQVLSDPDLAVGRKLRRAIGAGQPLLERHLDPLLDIEEGQTVTVQLQSQGIDIASTGKALAGGVAGDRILIDPPSGGHPVEAMILAPGIVRVRSNMPRRIAVKQSKRRMSWSV